MSLKEDVERHGTLFFRFRSFFPILLLGLFLIGLQHFHYPFNNHLLDIYWELFCLVISFFGLGIRFYTIGHVPAGTSGRNTKKQIADCINTSGIYSLLRHPLYFGIFFIWFGLSLFPRVWWISLLTILLFVLYYERIMFAEEEFLKRKFGVAYAEWANRTPIFFPNLKNWKRPELPFSLRNAIKREYHGFFAIILAFFILEIISDFILTGQFIMDPLWKSIFIISLIIYLVVRFLARKTKVLKVPGR